MSKNPCAKKVTPEKAYEVYSDGEWTYFVLKKYQTPEKEKDNLFARWYCMTTSPITPKGEYGDVYVSTVLRGTKRIRNHLSRHQEKYMMLTVYHVFTDERDLWTQEYRFARKLYTYWKKTRGAARLYKEVYEDEEAMLNDEMLEEDCLLAYGPFPL